MNDLINIVLVGMPGVGKSTVGVLLAKVLSREFLDTDLLIQAREGRRLQDLLNAEGREAFCRIEERHVRSLKGRGQVIATGGSVVYSEGAMRHLKAGGVIVHLDLPYAALERRLVDLFARGVVMEPGQSLRALYDEREPLYRRYADVTVDCSGLTHEQVVDRVIRGVDGSGMKGMRG
jgi:shikimate kinase